VVIGATVPFTEASCGYVGVNDGWTDLADNYRLDWQYDEALDGNIALTGGLDLSRGTEFTVGVAFGTTQHDTLSTLGQSLNIPFERTREVFIHQWEQTSKRFSLASKSNSVKLYERSVNLLLAHEDKTYSGAMIASLSIPWGDQKSDDELGGYHLVWTRDLVKSVTGLLAAGDTNTPLRSLIYLAVSQREDGGFYQNFWLDGRPYWAGIQLDEVAFPVLLTWRLWKNKALGTFLPFEMVRRACGFLIREGPMTAQDRWEEARGYSPSTLAVHIAALICAAEFFDDRGEHATAEFVRDYADFLESHIERWTVTTQGTLVPGIRRHYIRVNPASSVDCADDDPNCGTLVLANQRPGALYEFPAKEIVDAGFLELVRYGIRSADDPVIKNSLRVVDAVLKVDTPYGPAWRRYNHDGYGQREDGSSYTSWGKGRPWPLLTGERGHYEIAAGLDPSPYLRALENFSQGIGLMPEQIWDGPDLPSSYLRFGGPTDAAMPLIWAHSEYVKLIALLPTIESSIWSSQYTSATSLEPANASPLKSGNRIIKCNGTGGCTSAHTSGLSVSLALDQRRLAKLEGYEITRNSDWNRVRRYSPAGQAGKRHSIHFSLDGRKSVGRQGLHSERATRRRSSKEQKESAQKKGARPARSHSRIKVSLRIQAKSTLASLRAGLSITPRGVSILTILQFDTLLLIFGRLCGGI
jgi:glucoamylase